MNFFRNLAKSLREERLRAHYRWLRRNRVVLEKPRPDERMWSGAYMESLKQ